LSALPPAVVAIGGPFLFALLISLALVPICRSFALRVGLVATPRADRWHARPIALCGGVAIGVTLFIGLIAFGSITAIPVLAGGAALMFVGGLADDVFHLKPFTKLVIQIAIASLFLFVGQRLHWTSSPTLDTLLTLVWLVGMTNAFNLLDNMDGLAGGVALIVGAGLLLGLMPPHPGTVAIHQARYLALLVGATAGFLAYNVHPASIFMGDSGSLLLGLSFAAVVLSPQDEARAVSNPLSVVAGPVLVMLIPIFDTTFVTISRLLSGRRPSEGGRDHSSHRLVAVGLSEPTAVSVLWLLAGIGGALGVGVDYFNLSWSAPAVGLFLVAMLIFALYLSRIRVYDKDQADAISRGALTPLQGEVMYKQQIVEVLLDLVIVTIAYYSAYRLRFEGPDFAANFPFFYRSLPLVLAVQMVSLFVVGAYRSVWQYFGIMDVVGLGKGVLAGVVGSQLLLLYLYRFQSYSRAVFVIYGALALLALTVSRGSFRLVGEFVSRRHASGRRCLIYGADDGGALAVRELVAAPQPYRVVGFIDDNPLKRRLRVLGYPVLGDSAALASLVSSNAVDAVVVTSQAIDIARLQTLEELCRRHGVELLRLRVRMEQIIAS
jgi:UDP-GlcNAc:undecaprenyl-phosphate/decaprenyl-phosphate GlcNAc-1-phosphate transferase